MRKLIIRLIIKHFYTVDELFDRIRSRNLKKVRKFLDYLNRHDPPALERILQYDDGTNCFMAPLDYTLACAIDPEDFQIATALLESSPALYARLFEWDSDILFYAIKYERLSKLRLLFWYVCDGSLSSTDPKTGLTAEQLIMDSGQRYVTYQLRAWRTDPWVAQKHSNANAIMLSWYMARERFRLIQEADTELSAKHYETALTIYKKLAALCAEYAQLEVEINSSFTRDARPFLIKFYQDYGQRYVQEAYKACELWLQNFKADPATLNREQVAEYKRALTQAAALSQQLGNSKAEQRYTAVLSSLPSIELSPAATATHIAPAQVIVSDPSTHRSPYANQASIQHPSSLEEDPCYVP